MIRPAFLKKGAVIRMISPAGIIDPFLVEAAQAVLEQEGFKVILGENVFARCGRFAGTDTQRHYDLQTALDDPATDAILCTRGGYGLTRIIDKVDFSRMGVKPKWLIGFSDITVLHNALSSVGIESMHAVMCKQIGKKEAACENLLKCLKGSLPAYKTMHNEKNIEGHCRGRLTGGNLSLLYALQGTGFDIMPVDRILFLEDLCEPAYHIDRMIQSLRLAGVFDKIAGLIVGQFTDISGCDSFTYDAYGIIHEVVKDLGIPVSFDFPAGHTDNNMPLIMGAETELSVSADYSTIKQL